MCDDRVVWALSRHERHVRGEQGVDDGAVRFAAGTYVFPFISPFLFFKPPLEQKQEDVR